MMHCGIEKMLAAVFRIPSGRTDVLSGKFHIKMIPLS